MEELAEKFKEILHNKFINSYPAIFLKSVTKDPIIYKNANGCMYSWYIMILNNFSVHRLSPEYSQTKDESIKSNWSCAERFLKDFENSDCWQSFLIGNMQL